MSELDGLPDHPEDYDYVALLRHHDGKQTKWVVVPDGQSLEMDERAARPWLHPHLGTEWSLFEFVHLRSERVARSLERLLLEFDFLVESGKLPDVRNDIIFRQARLALGLPRHSHTLSEQESKSSQNGP